MSKLNYIKMCAHEREYVNVRLCVSELAGRPVGKLACHFCMSLYVSGCRVRGYPPFRTIMTNIMGWTENYFAQSRIRYYYYFRWLNTGDTVFVNSHKMQWKTKGIGAVNAGTEHPEGTNLGIHMTHVTQSSKPVRFYAP
jgi:hypothetical protein